MGTAEEETKQEGSTTAKLSPRHLVTFGIGQFFLIAVGLVVLVITRQVLLTILAAGLVAIMIDGIIHLLQRIAPGGRRTATAILVGLVLLGILIPGFLWGGVVVDQFQQLVDDIPQIVERNFSKAQSWMHEHLPGIGGNGGKENSNGGFIASTGLDVATAIGTGLIAALSALGLIFVLAIFLLINPGLYREGVVRMVPVPHRDEAEDVFTALHQTLRSWLLGKALAMVFVTIATIIGLMILDIPGAIALAIIAGALTFIPNFGPILAAIPAVLLAFSTHGLGTAAIVAALYTGIQLVEGSVVTPVIQQRVASVAPGLVLSAQLLAGVLLGPLGLVLAVPTVMVFKVLITELYVKPMEARHAPQG